MPGLLRPKISSVGSIRMSRGQWPILPKVTAFLFTAVAVVAAGWFVFLSGQNDELQAQRDREPQLKEEYRGKVAQAVNLGSCASSGSR